MKTIAELKEDVYQEWVGETERNDAVKPKTEHLIERNDNIANKVIGIGIDRAVQLERQSLSQKIAESVENCDYCVSYPEKIEGKFCKDLPSNLKCPGCKRLLEFKREIGGIDMVTIRFTQMEVQELLLWGNEYREKQDSVGIKWDDEQQRIIDKLQPKKEHEA